MTDLDLLLAEVAEEIESAKSLFPGYHSLHEAYGVLAEEVAEFFDVVREKDSMRKGYRARSELIQIAAVALRAIIDRDLR